nr:Host cell surface-exposed lipoprotein [Streptococcus thermophilus]
MSTPYPGPNNDPNTTSGSGATNNPYPSGQSPTGPGAQPGQLGQSGQPGQPGQPKSSYHRQAPQGPQQQQQNPYFGGLRNPQQPFQGAQQPFGAGPNGSGYPGQLGQQGQASQLGFQNVPHHQGQPNYFHQPGTPGPNPQAGAEQKSNGVILAVAAIGLLVALGALAAVLALTGGGDDESASAAGATTSSTNAAGSSETSASNSSSAAVAPADGEASDDYEEALEEAEIFLDVSSFSKEGLFDILTLKENDNRFTDEAARYAVDNVDADWKEEALENAESLRKHSDLSDDDIYRYLVDQSYGGKFTEEEGQYAIDNLE